MAKPPQYRYTGRGSIYTKGFNFTSRIGVKGKDDSPSVTQAASLLALPSKRPIGHRRVLKRD
jgi:hypothetical protein